MKTTDVELEILNRGFLFHNKYKYKAKTIILGAYHARHKKTIGEVIKEMDRIYSMYSFRREGIKKLSTKESLYVLDKFISLMNSGLDIACRIEREIVSFYFNDPEIVKAISEFTKVNQFQFIAKHDHKELHLVDPKYQFRTYIKSAAGVSHREVIIDFFNYSKNNPDLSFSPSLINVVNPKENRYMGINFYYFRSGFIDYNDEKMLTVIGLYFGSMVDYTVKLVKKERKKNKPRQISL